MKVILEEHPKVFRAEPVLTILGIGLSFVGIGLLILFTMWLKAIGEKLVVTDDNTLLVEKGILNKNRTKMNLLSIRTINVDQSLWDRMMGIGKISIYTTGDLPEAVIGGIYQPQRVHQLLSEAIRSQKVKA